jgi:hypothetical protein
VKHLALAITVLVALGSAEVTAQTPFDAAEYRIFYTQPKHGAVVPSPVDFVIKITGGYIVAREQACSPASACYGQFPLSRLADTGHCHTYVENLGRPGKLAAFDASCAENFSLELPPGDYCAYADLTHNDHVARVKPGPQSFPPSDKVCFRVRPGASGNS